jgi:hypothetical protein
VKVESPGNFAATSSASAIGGGEVYSTYEIEITDATPAEGQIDLLVSIISEEEDFAGFVPGTNTTAYFTHSVPVSGETPIAYHWEFDDITTFAGNHSYWNTTEFDDISPAIIEESDGDLALNWCGDDVNDVDPAINAIVWVRRSVDNGFTYGYEAARSAGDQGYHRCDTNKIAAGTMANAYAHGRYGPGIIFSDVIRVETGTANRGVLVSYTTQDLEVFVDAMGYIYCFDGAGTNVQMKHSQAPETLEPTSWHLPPYVFFTVATDADVSHVRSVDMDSSDVVWLAFYNVSQTRIGLARSTDASPHESWDSSTVVYTAGSGISQVRDPSLWIDGNDIFHICYTRFGMVTGEYELVYTKDDSAFDNPTEQVLYGAPGAISDTHISVGEKFGKEIIIVAYEHNKSIYLVTLVDGIALGPPQQIDGSTDDIDVDAILDADQCDFHAVWATMDGDNYDIARRNGVLVED